MKTPFRFVLVGTGSISNAYVDALRQLPGIELAGIVSRTGRRPSSLSDAVEIPIAAELALLPCAFDAVILATPNGIHSGDAMQAARLGKHVLCEKVLAISLDACDRMIEACEENHVYLGVSFQRRLNPVNRRLKRLIEEGALGRIVAVDVEAKFFRGEDYFRQNPYRGTRAIDGGGVFMQQASHDLDLLVWFFGLPKVVSSALGTFLHDIESEDHGAAIMKFECGAVGTLIASTCCKPQMPQKISIHSDRGTLVSSGDNLVTLEMEGLGMDDFEATATTNLPLGHEGVIQDFVDAVQNNRPPMVCGTEARKSVELIHRIYDAAF